MSTDRQIGGIFIQAAVRGMSEVQQNLQKVQSTAQATQKQFSSPLKISADISGASTSLQNLTKSLASLPTQERITVIADGLKATNEQILILEKELSKVSGVRKVTVQTQLQKTQDLQSQLAAISKVPILIPAKIQIPGSPIQNQKPGQVPIKVVPDTSALDTVKRTIASLPAEKRVSLTLEGLSFVEAEMKKLSQQKVVPVSAQLADLNKIHQQLSSLVPPPLVFDDKQARASIGDLKKALSDLPAKSINLLLDQTAAITGLNSVKKELASLPHEDKVSILVATQEALRGIESVQKGLQGLPTGKVSVLLDDQTALENLSALHKGLLTLTDQTIEVHLGTQEPLAMLEDLKKNLANLPPARLEALIDSTQLDVFKKELDALPHEEKLQVVLSASEALAGLAQLSKQVEAIPSAKVKVETDEPAIQRLNKELDQLSKPRRVEVDVPTSFFGNLVQQAQTTFAQLKSTFSKALPLPTVKGLRPATPTPGPATPTATPGPATPTATPTAGPATPTPGPATAGPATAPVPKSFTSGLSEALKSVTSGLDQLQSKIVAIGNSAQTAFSTATASIIGFVRQADPGGFAKLEGVIGALSVQIGSIFIPLLDTVTAGLKNVLGWFRALSDEQKSNILQWVKVGLVITGILAVIPKLVAGFSLVSAAISTLGAVTGLATGGLTTILGLAAALVSAVIGIGIAGSLATGEISVFSGVLESLKPILSGLQGVLNVFLQGFKQVFSALQPLIEAAISGIATTIQRLTGVFAGLVDRIVPVFVGLIEKITPIIGQFSGSVLPILQGFASGFVDIFNSLIVSVGPILQKIGSVIGTVLQKVVPIVGQVVSSLKPIFTSIVGVIAGLIPIISGVIGQLVDKVGSTLEEIIPSIQSIANDLGPVFSSIGEIIQAYTPTILELAKSFGEVFVEIQSAVLTLLPPIVKGISDFVKGASADFVKLTPTIIEASKQTFVMVKAFTEFVTYALTFVGPAIKFLATSIGYLLGFLNDVGSVVRGIVVSFAQWAVAINSVLVPAIDLVKSALQRMVEFFYSSIDGLIDYTNKLITKINALPSTLAKIPLLEKPERSRIKEKVEKGAGAAFDPGPEVPEAKKPEVKKTPTTPTAERFTPLPVQKYEFGSLLDAYKRAQQAVGGPADSAMNEQKKLQERSATAAEKQNSLLEDLLEVTKQASQTAKPAVFGK